MSSNGKQPIRYELTAHARHVIGERKILISWVEGVLEKPGKTEADPDDVELTHVLGRIAENGSRVLRVVYNHKSAPLKIVTAYFDRTMKDKL